MQKIWTVALHGCAFGDTLLSLSGKGNLQKPYQSINTSYPIRKTWWLYLLLEKNLAISFAGAVGNRFVYKSSLSSEMANVFGE
jgi:hypothetical protein